VIASFQVVGTTSKSGGTWLWAWANKSWPYKVTEAVRHVCAFGDAENLTELTQESLPDDEYLGWGMSAVAARPFDLQTKMLLAPTIQSNRSARNAAPVFRLRVRASSRKPRTTMVLTKNRELGRFPGTDCEVSRRV
jgi:hypothetical protein